MHTGGFDYSRYPQISGELFRAMQEAELFADAKTLVDADVTAPVDLVTERYRGRRGTAGFDLEEFVDEHFESPEPVGVSPDLPTGRTVADHVEELWTPLTRTFDAERTTGEPTDGGTLLSLPEPHVVPGGRFREMYYWDSYFVAEGLAATGHLDRVEGMVENVASLIDRFGFVPLGNRVYYDSRSQLPVFVLLLRLLERERGTDAVEPHVERLETEYEFWMDGSNGEDIGGGRIDHGDDAEPVAHRRAVALPDGPVLNRFWDDRARPRPEAYRHDRALADAVPIDDRPQLFRDIRAACESGWDFSSRWLDDSDDLASMRTTDLLPVDLNAVLYAVESALAEWLPRLGREDAAAQFEDAALRRADAIRELCWQDDLGHFVDYDWRAGEPVDRPTLAGVAPLFVGLATDQQAAAVAATLREDFLHDGGLVTTLETTGEQWDAPNGWAPLQWLAVIGLRRYGHDGLAAEIADRWLDLNRAVFQETGRMAEKYDVRTVRTAPDSGEYPVQYGFGWTNGVAVALQKLPKPAIHPEP